MGESVVLRTPLSSSQGSRLVALAHSLGYGVHFVDTLPLYVDRQTQMDIYGETDHVLKGIWVSCTGDNQADLCILRHEVLHALGENPVVQNSTERDYGLRCGTPQPEWLTWCGKTASLIGNSRG